MDREIKTKARYYDPGTGRFLSVDPLGFDSEDANLYRYVKNNPLLLKDLSSKFWQVILAGAVANAAGFFVGTLVGGGSFSDAGSAAVSGFVTGATYIPLSNGSN